MIFADIYPLYLNKAERKGRTQLEVNQIIFWLTGYDDSSLKSQLNNQVTLADFFTNAPQINQHAHLITGVICGHRVEDITDPILQKIRYLDKLIDELAKGKSLEKILRK
jgi:hypothetical protein